MDKLDDVSLEEKVSRNLEFIYDSIVKKEQNLTIPKANDY